MTLSQLIENYDDLTELERKVVEYIVTNPEEIPYLTANELAKKLYVSKTSIINLCKKLNFDGDSELRYYVKHHINKKEYSKNIASFQDILSNIYEEITKTLSLQNEENIKNITKKIKISKAVYVVARGASKPIADLFCSRLTMMKIKSIAVNDPNLIDILSENLTEGETLILISLSGETEKIINLAKTTKSQGIDIIALTAFSNNRLQRIANYNMFCFADDTETKYNDLISRIGLQTLTQIIISYLDIIEEENLNES